MVTSTRPPALCAGEAPDEKLQINELGPNMIGSRAESQLHIHSINNDPNLACADYLPMIVWPAKLCISCKPDTFCSAASDLCLIASTIEEVDAA